MLKIPAVAERLFQPKTFFRFRKVKPLLSVLITGAGVLHFLAFPISSALLLFSSLAGNISTFFQGKQRFLRQVRK